MEVLNDAYMKVFLNIENYDIQKPFTSWFRRILINTAINYHKKNIRHNHQDLEKIPEPPDTHNNPLDEMGYQEMIRLIQTLPLAYRTVFNLYVIEGFTHEEIAALLHVSVGDYQIKFVQGEGQFKEYANKKS